MKQYIEENWREISARFADGLKWGLLAAILMGVALSLSDLESDIQAALTIVRDLRGEFRSAVGSSGPKEGTEE